mmetsp:Transcript_5571/g.9563  ORF Transcript_5571/g.9563 Transcript_5571/m.9563 type:complete len:124 (+) Transcript_5571:372-743(+)
MSQESEAPGENSIMIVGGANQDYASELPPEWVSALETADVLLMQREIPESINIKAAQIVKGRKQQGQRLPLSILDVGGADTPLSPSLLECLDYISPNESELERIHHALSGGASSSPASPEEGI